MDPEGQTDPHWEVLGVPPALAGVPAYQPAARYTRDGVVLEGTAKLVGDRDWGRLQTIIAGLLGSGFFCWAATIDLHWLWGVLGLFLICAVSLLTYKPVPRTSWAAPVVTVNSEGIHASDVSKQTHSGVWAELGKLRARAYSGLDGEEIHLSWATPEGAYVTANLGNTIDLMALRQAILRQAPESMTFRLGAKGSYGKE